MTLFPDPLLYPESTLYPGSTPTIVGTVDATLRRIEVLLTDWSTDGPIVVTGSSGDTSWPVRSISAVSAGTAAGYDYEMPLNADVTYSAWDAGSLITSESVTVGSTQPMLRAPSLPSLDQAVEIVSLVPVQRQRPQAVLRPIGRRTAIVLPGDLPSGEFSLTVRTRTDVAAQGLEDLVASSPVLLLDWPGTRRDHCYVSTGGLDESPVVEFITPDGEVGTWAEWAIPCTVVVRPVGDVFGDPTASYQAGLDTYATYTDSLAAQPTYLDRLRGL